MASIQKYQTQKGDRWMYTIENGIDPSTGKRSRIVKRGFLKEKEAKKAAQEVEYQLGKWNIDLKNQISFADMADEWLDVYSQTSVKISTIRVRNHEIGHLKKYFAYVKLRDVTKKMYQNLLTSLKNEGLAHNTISGIHGTARMIFKRAMEQDILSQDPTEYAYIPKDKKTVEDIENTNVEEKYLEKHELKLFLDTAEKNADSDDYVIFLTLAWTGLRVGELLALKWRDIDFNEQTINITKTYYNPNNNTKKFTLLPPKTDGSIRKIDVEDEIIIALKKHRIKQKEVKLVVGNEYFDDDFIFVRLFPPYYGYPHFIKTVENRMASLLKKIDNKKHLTPHSLRHTHTSLLAEAGVELTQIMDRLGHTDDETTTQVYLHITKDRKKEASQKFGKLMRSL